MMTDEEKLKELLEKHSHMMKQREYLQLEVLVMDSKLDFIANEIMDLTRKIRGEDTDDVKA